MCLMQGKCFSCGSTAHTKKDGNHECNICAYCKHVGHQEPVCMDKFLKKACSQKAAETGEAGLPNPLALCSPRGFEPTLKGWLESPP